MKPHSLRAVIRLRQSLVEEAGRHLANCIEAETEATEAVRELAAEIARQRAAAEEIDSSDADVEAFIAWLGRERGRLEELSAAQDRATVLTGQARAELLAARAALKAVEMLRDEAARAAALEEQRREQRDIDEIAGRSRGSQSLNPQSLNTRPDESADGIA